MNIYARTLNRQQNCQPPHSEQFYVHVEVLVVDVKNKVYYFCSLNRSSLVETVRTSLAIVDLCVHEKRQYIILYM